MADYSIINTTPSTLNIRTIYDNAIQGFSDGQNAILQYSDVKMEFFRGTAYTDHLKYATSTVPVQGWWTVTGNVASYFIYNPLTAGQDLPLIGSKVSNIDAAEGNCQPGWLACHPAQSSTGNSGLRLAIKITPQNNKKITGYILYYQDQDANNNAIGLDSGQNGSLHQSSRIYPQNNADYGNFKYIGIYGGYNRVFSYTKDLTSNPVTSSGYIYVHLDAGNDGLAYDSGTIRMELDVVDPYVPTPLTFVNNTLTVTNGISSTDLDMVSFQLPAGSIMYSFNVTSLLNATSITYTLGISGGAIVSTGTITTTGVDLLGVNNLTPAVDTTYILTLTSISTNTYTIIGKMLGPGYTFSSVLAAGGTFKWNSISNSNAYAQTYVTDFVDLSGGMLIRHDGKLTVGGDASFNNVTLGGANFLANDLAITSRLFVRDNVSTIGNMKVGNDLSANGQFSGNFASNLIPTTAIINYPSSGSGSTVITGNVRIAGDVSFNGATVDLSTNTVLQVDDYITFNDGSTMNSFDDLKSRMFDMSASLVTTTTVTGVLQGQRILCSSDGKYVAINMGGASTNATNYAQSSTGIDISQDYGATFTRKYLNDPTDGTTPLYRPYSCLSISLTGQFMICCCYGATGHNRDDNVVGFSNNYGATWSSAYLKNLLGTDTEMMYIRGVAISSDGATMIIDVFRFIDNNMHLYKTTSRSLSGFTLISSRVSPIFADNTLKLVKGGGVERIVAQLLDSGKIVIYDISGGTNLHTSTYDYGVSTDISIPFNAINSIITGSAGQISRVDCREDFVYNNPMVTDISTIYSGDTRRKSSVQSPLGKHILVGPFINSYNCPDIKDANGLRYSTNGGYRFKQVSGLVSTTFTAIKSVALSDRGHMYIVDDIGPGQVKYVAATFELMRNVTFKKVDVIGVANVTGSVTTSSDYRIKENVSNLNNTDTIDNLVPIQYNNILTGKHEFGLLAHELQSIYPEFVEGEKDGAEYQRVDYNGLIGVLVKEVQDLKKRVAVLNQ